MSNNKPKTYLDKPARQSKHYFFISYSHENSGYVYEHLTKLFESGVNYWYDTELNVGCIWNEKVKDALTSELCCGAILFLSEKSVASSAVYKEVCCINERSKRDENFHVVPVLLGFKTYGELLQTIIQTGQSQFIGAYATLMRDGTRIFDVGGEGKGGSGNEDDSEKGFFNAVVSAATKSDAIDRNSIDIRNLVNWPALMAKREFTFEFGSYPSDREGNGSKITWRIFKCVENLIYFVSEYCLDFLDYDTVSKVQKLSPRAFGLANEKSIVEFSLIPCAVIEQYRDQIGLALPTDYADERRMQSLRLFWALDEADDRKMKLYNSANYEVYDVVPIENEKFTAGIRLYMVLDDNKLDNYKRPTEE